MTMPDQRPRGPSPEDDGPLGLFLWNQATLRFQFQDRYTHVRHLGNPNYASGGPITLLAPERALDDIEQWLRTRSLILMCACQDANFCHRTAAAVWLKRRLFLEHVYHIDTYGISPGR